MRYPPANREPEFELFNRMLAGETEERILLVEAGGGMGKTTLLEAFMRHCPRHTHCAPKDWGRAEQLFQAALRVHRDIGHRFNTGLALRRLGAVAEGRGDGPQAIQFYREALQLFEAIGVQDAELTRADLERLEGEVSG